MVTVVVAIIVVDTLVRAIHTVDIIIVIPVIRVQIIHMVGHIIAEVENN